MAFLFNESFLLITSVLACFFDYHINVTMGKALKVLGFLKRSTNVFSSALLCPSVRFTLPCSLYFETRRHIVLHFYLAKVVISLEWGGGWGGGWWVWVCGCVEY